MSHTTTQIRMESVSAAEHPNCLMCCAMNPLGLNLTFRVQDDGSVLAMFPCLDGFQGYPETLHGGVISALLDAAMTHVLFSIGIVGLTAELNVRFLAPVVLNRGAVVHASIEKDSHPLYYVNSQLEQSGDIKARASAKFMVKGY